MKMTYDSETCLIDNVAIGSPEWNAAVKHAAKCLDKTNEFALLYGDAFDSLKLGGLTPEKDLHYRKKMAKHYGLKLEELTDEKIAEIINVPDVNTCRECGAEL